MLKRAMMRLIVLTAIVIIEISSCANQPTFSERLNSKPTTSTLPATSTPTQVFTTLPPGTKLPSEADCASRVRRASWEPRPDNFTANHSVPSKNQISKLASWDSSIGLDSKADSFRKPITGNFTGTTDEILQWVACKWGIDEDIVRAEAVTESYWHQSQVGDWTTNRSLCPPNIWDGTGCYQSYGILQIKYIYNSTTWPMNRDDTAFNAEYTYGLLRVCYEGWTTYLYDETPLSGYPRYQAGDLWGCIGTWYSGNWYDQRAINYINSVKTELANKVWLQPGF